jgi:hypothetical protein
MFFAVKQRGKAKTDKTIVNIGRVRGKLIWKSLKTDRISVAKLRLSDFHREERQRAAAQTAVARGKMTFADALETYRERLKYVPR